MTDGATTTTATARARGTIRRSSPFATTTTMFRFLFAVGAILSRSAASGGRGEEAASSIASASSALEGTETTIATVETSAMPLGSYPHAFEPYRSYECLPRRVHLAVGDDDDDPDRSGYVAAVTVSFSLDRRRRGGGGGGTDAANDGDGDGGGCGPDRAVPSVAVGRKGVEGESTTTTTRIVRARRSDLRQFDVTNEGGVYYESDWIYHVEISGLDRGAEHWYRIEVRSGSIDDDDDDDGDGDDEEDGGDPPPPPPVLLPALSDSEELPSLRRDRRRRLGRKSEDRIDDGRNRLLRGDPFSASAGAEPPIGSSMAITAKFKFTATPPRSAPTKIAIVGDLGQTVFSTTTAKHVLESTLPTSSSDGRRRRRPTSLILCAGDLSYADGDQSRWTNWFDLMEPLLSKTPMAAVAGNHEIECDAVTRDVFVAYENYLRMPNRIGAAVTKPVDEEYVKTLWKGSCNTPSSFRGSYDYGNAYYSFEHGLVKVVALSSYSDASVGSVQYRWLARELKRIDRSVTPWVVVMFHSPLYTTFRGHNDESQTVVMRSSVESLFVEHSVNLLVSGHDHAYMRTKPLVPGPNVDPTGKGPVHVIVGAGGNRENHTHYLNDEPEEWIEKRNDDEYGFGILDVVDAKRARWTWVKDGKASDGTEDDVWLDNQFFL